MEGGLDQLAEVELGAVEGGVGVFGVVDVAGLDERAELAEFYELGFVDDAGAEVVVEGLAEGFEEVAGGVSGGEGGVYGGSMGGVWGSMGGRGEEEEEEEKEEEEGLLDFTVSLLTREVGIKQPKLVHTNTPHEADPTPRKRHQLFILRIRRRRQLRHPLRNNRPDEFLPHG